MLVARDQEERLVEHAVHRLTAEIADYLEIDAGRIVKGARADVVLLDPAGLDDRVEAMEYAPLRGMEGVERLVRRNDDAVRGVWIGGRRAWGDGPTSVLGVERLGRVLRRRA